MPIKFRCQFCHQLLGIAHSKAGSAVDCPKCGRLMRVPMEGIKPREPVKPEWNLRDPALADALNELALIGKATAEEDELREALEPAPSPEPLNPVRQPAVVQLQAETPQRATAVPRDATLQPGNVQSGEVKSDFKAGTSSPDFMAAALASLAAPAGANRPASAARNRRAGAGWRITLTVAGGLAAVGAGFWAGHEAGVRRQPSAAGVPDAPAAGVPQAALQAGPASPAGVPVSAATEVPAPAIIGRITYVNNSGESHPDRGATVIALPKERHREARLSAIGFRPSDSGTDCILAAAAARALGGDLAIAGEDGTFRITLPGAGEYEVLALSHFEERQPGPPPAPLRIHLENYFERPDQLLGRFACHGGIVRYKGTGSEIWDHAFLGK